MNSVNFCNNVLVHWLNKLKDTLLKMSPTVSLTNTASPRVLKMVFQPEVVEDDLLATFKAITRYLNQTNDSVYVIVDIQARPNFLMAAVIDGALDGPFVHPRLANWLIIGHSRRGRVIEKAMTAITRRRNVLWFNSPDEALCWLQQNGIEPILL